MRADLDLQQKQAFWETPRNIVILLVAVVAVVVIAAVVGFMLGQTIAQREQPQTIIRFEPGSIVAPPAPAK